MQTDAKIAVFRTNVKAKLRDRTENRDHADVDDHARRLADGDPSALRIIA